MRKYLCTNIFSYLVFAIRAYMYITSKFVVTKVDRSVMNNRS